MLPTARKASAAFGAITLVVFALLWTPALLRAPTDAAVAASVKQFVSEGQDSRAWFKRTFAGAQDPLIRELLAIPDDPAVLEAEIRREAWFSYGFYALQTLAGLVAGALMLSRRRGGVVLAVALGVTELIRDAYLWRRSFRSFVDAQQAMFRIVPLDTLRTDITAIWGAAAIVLVAWILIRRRSPQPEGD